MSQQTVGDVFDERGPCLLMAKVMDLAEQVGRMPFGEWDYRFQSDPRWRVCVNGGTSSEWTPPDAPAIKRFESYVEFNGWPAATFNTVDGAVIGITEDRILVAFEQEISDLRLTTSGGTGLSP